MPVNASTSAATQKELNSGLATVRNIEKSVLDMDKSIQRQRTLLSSCESTARELMDALRVKFGTIEAIPGGATFSMDVSMLAAYKKDLTNLHKVVVEYKEPVSQLRRSGELGVNNPTLSPIGFTSKVKNFANAVTDLRKPFNDCLRDVEKQVKVVQKKQQELQRKYGAR